MKLTFRWRHADEYVYRVVCLCDAEVEVNRDSYITALQRATQSLAWTTRYWAPGRAVSLREWCVQAL